MRYTDFVFLLRLRFKFQLLESCVMKPFVFFFFLSFYSTLNCRIIEKLASDYKVIWKFLILPKWMPTLFTIFTQQLTLFFFVYFFLLVKSSERWTWTKRVKLLFMCYYLWFDSRFEYFNRFVFGCFRSLSFSNVQSFWNFTSSPTNAHVFDG